MVEYPIGEVARCQTPADYHRLNLRLLRREITSFLPGKPLHKYNAIMDWKSQVSPDAFVGRNVFLGKHVLVDHDARVERDCMLANGVVVGAGARLKNVSVLPNTHVLPGSEFENAVLGPNGYFDLLASVGKTAVQKSSAGLAASRDASTAATGLPRALV